MDYRTDRTITAEQAAELAADLSARWTAPGATQESRRLAIQLEHIYWTDADVDAIAAAMGPL